MNSKIRVGLHKAIGIFRLHQWFFRDLKKYIQIMSLDLL
jgi:hypothetical protein